MRSTFWAFDWFSFLHVIWPSRLQHLPSKEEGLIHLWQSDFEQAPFEKSVILDNYDADPEGINLSDFLK